jgi:hypothetical protein
MWVIQSWVLYALIFIQIQLFFISILTINYYKKMTQTFVELKEFIAKNVVTAEQVQGLVDLGVQTATAGLATSILDEAKFYTDGKDFENDGEANLLAEFANRIATKVNQIGAIVGVEV